MVDDYYQDPSAFGGGKSKRRVTFHSKAKMLTTSKLTDLTSKSSLWYTKEDLVQIQSKCTKIINNEKRGCTRGLESRSADGSYLKRMNRLDVRNAVFDLQEEQRETGCLCDPEIIATASRQLSFNAREEAHLMGLLDERFVLVEQQAKPPSRRHQSQRHDDKRHSRFDSELTTASTICQPRRRSIVSTAA